MVDHYKSYGSFYGIRNGIVDPVNYLRVFGMDDGLN